MSPSKDTHGHFEAIKTTSDLIKTVIVIIIQSISIGAFLTAIKFDLSHLQTDFKDFKEDMKHQISDLQLSIKDLNQTKNRVESLAEENHRSLSRMDSIVEELRQSRDNVQELKFVVRDVSRDLETLKQKETERPKK